MNQRQWRLLLPPLVFGIVSFFWSVHITSTPPHDEEGFIISAASIRSGAGLLRFASKMWTCRHNKCKHQQNRETTCPRGGVVSARHTRPHAPCFPRGRGETGVSSQRTIRARRLHPDAAMADSVISQLQFLSRVEHDGGEAQQYQYYWCFHATNSGTACALPGEGIRSYSLES